MNRKAAVYLAVSVDGYIATEEDRVDWLEEVPGEGDNGYGAFYETVDTVVIGRRTYDWVMKETDGDYPYAGKEGYVVSREPERASEHVTFTKNPEQLIERLKGEKGGRIWIVGGGRLIHSLLKADAVDELILTVAPVVLGSGRPLFYRTSVREMFSLHSVERYGDFVELHYKKRGADS
ncbi:dihydrofolate reductase family protein [Alteribacter natronophilus]|uniref:dihydrofolate reductase family protein n=1 Tax=Alteribacter natronophilus TaxID=2583810 RepID=UPI00110D9689|nr:dihydrofolate reductase family protein [Alteribacter natronophilus]TMW72864.1 dihydrofolate reductase [Alteribacter natronophilus]